MADLVPPVQMKSIWKAFAWTAAGTVAIAATSWIGGIRLLAFQGDARGPHFAGAEVDMVL